MYELVVMCFICAQLVGSPLAAIVFKRPFILIEAHRAPKDRLTIRRASFVTHLLLESGGDFMCLSNAAGITWSVPIHFINILILSNHMQFRLPSTPRP